MTPDIVFVLAVCSLAFAWAMWASIWYYYNTRRRRRRQREED